MTYLKTAHFQPDLGKNQRTKSEENHVVDPSKLSSKQGICLGLMLQKIDWASYYGSLFHSAKSKGKCTGHKVYRSEDPRSNQAPYHSIKIVLGLGNGDISPLRVLSGVYDGCRESISD